MYSLLLHPTNLSANPIESNQPDPVEAARARDLEMQRLEARRKERAEARKREGLAPIREPDEQKNARAKAEANSNREDADLEERMPGDAGTMLEKNRAEVGRVLCFSCSVAFALGLLLLVPLPVVQHRLHLLPRPRAPPGRRRCCRHRTFPGPAARGGAPPDRQMTSTRLLRRCHRRRH